MSNSLFSLGRAPVLVTGGAGFIGSHLADRLLADEHPVVILDNESTGFPENVPAAAHYIRGDVRSPEDVERAFAALVALGDAPAVFHVAGQASIIKSFDDPFTDLDVNTRGTLHVLQACLRHRVGRLLYASSMVAYGQPSQVPTPETHPCRPVSYYGITKYAAECYVHATAARTDLGFPLHATSFRMFNVYGERQSLSNYYQGVVTIFIANILKGEPIAIYGDGEQSRDFIYVSDVVDAWVGALDNPAAYGRVINVGTGTHKTINHLVDVTLAALGRSRADWQVRYEPARPGDQRRVAAEISRAREVLGWEPRVPFEEGMTRTVQWAVGQIAD